MMDETQEQVIDWLASGQKGASSECMAMWLAFNKRIDDGFGPAHPYDPSDLNRCLLLLDRAPGLRSRIGHMGQLSKVWQVMAERWHEMEESFLAEVGQNWLKAKTAPNTYKLMKDIIASP